MRSALRQLLAYVLSLALLTAPAWGAASSPLGVVVAADRAHIGKVQASTGTTVFDGDTVSTEMQGNLLVRAGVTLFQLSPSSSAIVKQTSQGFRATLNGGTVALSSATAAGIELHASGARIRPQGNGPTQAQVTLVSPRELLVTARRGALEIAVDEDTQIVPEGTSYRVLMDPPDPTEPAGAGPRQPVHKTKRAGRNRFILIPIILITLATIWALHEVCESPQRP